MRMYVSTVSAVANDLETTHPLKGFKNPPPPPPGRMVNPGHTWTHRRCRDVAARSTGAIYISYNSPYCIHHALCSWFGKLESVQYSDWDHFSLNDVLRWCACICCLFLIQLFNFYCFFIVIIEESKSFPNSCLGSTAPSRSVTGPFNSES